MEKRDRSLDSFDIVATRKDVQLINSGYVRDMKRYGRLGPEY